MQNMKEINYEEQEMDLGAFLLYLLEQWRMILLVGIVAGVLVVGLGYIRSGRPSTPPTVEEIAEIAPLDLNAEYRNIYYTVYYYLDFKLLEDGYTKNNPYSFFDLKDSNYVVSIYRINKVDTDGDIMVISEAYRNLQSDDAFTSKLAKFYSEDMEWLSLWQMVSIDVIYNASYSDADTAVLYVRAYIPNGKTIEQWQRVVAGALKEYESNCAATIGKHEIKLVATNSRKPTAIDINRAEAGIYSGILESKTTYLNMYNSLSTTQKEVFNSIKEEKETKLIEKKKKPAYSIDAWIKELDKEWPAYEDKAKTSYDAAVVERDARVAAQNEAIALAASPSRHFSKKYLVLGFILGVVGYCGVAFLRLILKRVMRNEDELMAVTGIRNFGGVYEYPYDGALQRFMHDKKIYEYRRRYSKNIEAITDDVVAKLEFGGVKELTIVVLGKQSKAVSEFTKSQKQLFINKGINTSIMVIEQEVFRVADSEFCAANNILIEMISNETKWSMIGELAKRFAEYNNNIVGSEFVELKADGQ